MYIHMYVSFAVRHVWWPSVYNFHYTLRHICITYCLYGHALWKEIFFFFFFLLLACCLLCCCYMYALYAEMLDEKSIYVVAIIYHVDLLFCRGPAHGAGA